MSDLVNHAWTRRQVIDQVAATFRWRPLWMGYYSIRCHAGLACCPEDVYTAALAHMVRLGLLISLAPTPKRDYAVYMLSALTYRAGRRRRSKGGAR